MRSSVVCFAVTNLLASAGCAGGTEAVASNVGGSGGQPALAVGGGGGSVACDEAVYQGKALPSDLLIVGNAAGVAVSQQASLQAAMAQFTQSTDVSGVGLAISGFPRYAGDESSKQISDCSSCLGICSTSGTKGDCMDVTCDPADYQWFSLQNDFQTLPSNVIGGWWMVPPTGFSLSVSEGAMAPAMSGAVEWLSGWALNHHDQNPAIVLVTDSGANGTCAGTTADIAKTAADAASGKAAIRTYVITLATVPALDAIAVSGGSVAAQSVAPSEVDKALLKVVQQMRACAYSIPVPSKGSFDPSKVNVRVQGTQDRLAQVANATECAADQGGWYYDDPTDPRKILLCHESCATLSEASKGVDILMGCPTIEAPK